MKKLPGPSKPTLTRCAGCHGRPQRRHRPALPPIDGPKGVLGLAALFLTAQQGMPDWANMFYDPGETETMAKLLLTNRRRRPNSRCNR